MDDWKRRLRQAREAKGLNKTEFSRQVGVSNPTVTDWEKSVEDGGIKEIAGGNLTKVCRVLGIDPNWLLHGAEPQKSNGVLSLEAETASELKLLIVYRSANEREREAIDDLVEEMRVLIDARGRHQAKRTG
jgi:transcriptional regulator with XRE-family HTH domain